MRKVYILFFFSFIIFSCSDKNKVPRGILPPLKMKEVMWDMISAGEFLNGYVLNKDSADRMAESAKEYGRVLQFHHLTKEEFEKSYLYYRQHPELMKVILDSLSKRQIPPEELYKPKIDTTKVDTAVKKMDTAIKKTDTTRLDTLRKRIPRKLRPRRH